MTPLRDNDEGTKNAGSFQGCIGSGLRRGEMIGIFESTVEIVEKLMRVKISPLLRPLSIGRIDSMAWNSGGLSFPLLLASENPL